MTDVPNTICAYIGKYVEVIVVLSIALYIIGSLVSFPFMVWFVDFDTVSWPGKISMMIGFSVMLVFLIGIGAGIASFVIENWPRKQYTEEFITYGVWSKTKDWLAKRIEYLCEPIEFVD
jgi:hypothetical protein